MEEHAGIGDPPSNGEQGATVEATKRAAPRARAARPLPTDRLKFDAQVNALKAIVVDSANGRRAVGADEIAARIGVVAATAGLNNAFFMDAGLVIRESKGKYKPTAAAIEFNRAIGFDAETAKAALREPLAKTWFYKAIRDQVALGDPGEESVIRVLTHQAGAGVEHRPKLEALIDWLKYAGLITIAGGKVTVIDQPEAPEAPGEDVRSANGTPPTPEGSPEGEKPTTALNPPVKAPSVLDFSFDFQLTAEDLATLEPEQIKALFEAVGGVMSVQAALSKGEQK